MDDNFHFMDAATRSEAGEYQTAEAAIAAARAIVDQSLRSLYREGSTAEKLYADYQNFGEDPFIMTDDENCRFSAWEYAEKKCRELCGR